MTTTNQTIVMATGVFDILHLGHIYYLEQSKKLGDKLYVVIARDSTAESKKGKPFNDEKTRMQVIKALHCVDEVILGDKDFEKKHMNVIKKIHPNIVTIGHDQKHNPKEMSQRILDATNIRVMIKKIPKYRGKFNKTSDILQQIYTHQQHKLSKHPQA
ncbi:MAG: adenylyltransferase/cytidyltransferase family protein [bacterium]